VVLSQSLKHWNEKKPNWLGWAFLSHKGYVTEIPNASNVNHSTAYDLFMCFVLFPEK